MGTLGDSIRKYNTYAFIYIVEADERKRTFEENRFVRKRGQNKKKTNAKNSDTKIFRKSIFL